MARIRSIKPELLEDGKVARLPHLAWRLFVSLILLSDDYGNLRGDPERIHGAALWAHPRDDIGNPREDFANALECLVDADLVVPYDVRGQRYVHIAGWEKHQKVDHPGKPLCPGLSEGSRLSRESLARIPDGLAPDLDQDPDQDQEGRAPVAWPGPIGEPDPFKTTGLISLVRAAVEKANPKLGLYQPGQWAIRSVTAFLDEIPAESRTDILGAEIRRRIGLFAASTDTRITKGCWSVEAFCESYNRLGQLAAAPAAVSPGVLAAGRAIAAECKERYR